MLPRRSACALVVGLAGLVACGGDDGVGGFRASDSCALNLAITGGVAATFDHDNGVACLTSLSGGAGGVQGELVPIQHPSGLTGVDVEMPTLARGMTGETTADVILHTADDIWRAACDALVEEHREEGAVEFGTRYRLVASLTCAAPATSDDTANAPITIDALDFVYTITWTQ